MRKIQFFFIVVVLVAILTSCDRSDKDSSAIVIFVPGVLEGSPTYEMMDSGVRKAAKSAGLEVKVVEGGFDQASWESQLMTLASEGHYGLIVTSNPAMTEIAAKATDSFPDQDILVLDGSGLTGDEVADVVYNHMEQAFVIGYFAGLVTTSTELDGSNPDLRVGMIVGQEYPQMNLEIYPGFEIGLHTVNPDIELEFRVLGNWYDAEKARELAAGLYDSGVDVILTIAGGANQGVIAAAKEAEAYVLWFDSDGTDLAPGVVLASAVLQQEAAAENWTRQWIAEELEMGVSQKVGFIDGYVDFPLDGKQFQRYVPQSIQDKMAEVVSRMKKGTLNLRVLDE